MSGIYGAVDINVYCGIDGGESISSLVLDTQGSLFEPVGRVQSVLRLRWRLLYIVYSVRSALPGYAVR